MKRILSLALAGAIAASSFAVTTGEAAADKRHYRPHHHHQPPQQHHRHRRGNDGSGLAAGLFFGLTAGALAHSLATPRYYYPPPPVGYAPVPYPAAVPAPSANSQWCAANFPSYDYRTNSIMDAYGVRRPCFGPY